MPGPAPTGGVMVVGPSGHFASGVSQFTARLATELADPDSGQERVSVLLLRRLCPHVLYPGRERVGDDLTDLRYPAGPLYDGVDYYWLPSMLGALRFIRRVRPDAIVLQWWTGTVAHTHLALAAAARSVGAAVIVEFHESLDIGERGLPLVGRYGAACMRRLARMSSGVIVHSEHDRVEIGHALGVDVPAAVVHHPPFDQYGGPEEGAGERSPGAPVRLLYFGVIRPHKGVDDLVHAFFELRRRGVAAHLRVVGEVWQGYDAPLRRLAGSPYASDTAVETRYVADSEVAGIFAEADVVVLPYRRASASGPLAIAMARGLPVVTTDLPALREVAAPYTGAVLCRPGDPQSLAVAIERSVGLVGPHHHSPTGWTQAIERIVDLLDMVAPTRANRSTGRLCTSGVA